MLRALVTGYPGALARPLVEDLLANGLEVVAVARPKQGRVLRPRANLSILIADILDEDFEEQVSHYGHFDVIFHLAGFVQYRERTPGEAEETNVFGTRKMLQVASFAAKKIVYAGTCYAAGRRVHLGEDDATNSHDGENVYERTKAEAEAEIKKYRGSSLIVRLATVIGDSITGEIDKIGGLTGFAGMVYGSMVRRRALGYKDHPLLLGVNPNSTMNLVDRGWAITTLRLAGLSNVQGTVHVSHTHPVEMGWLFEETFRKGLDLPLTYDHGICAATGLFGDSKWMNAQDSLKECEKYFGHYILEETIFGHERIKTVPGYTPPPPITSEVIQAQISYMKRTFFQAMTGPRRIRKAA